MSLSKSERLPDTWGWGNRHVYALVVGGQDHTACLQGKLAMAVKCENAQATWSPA